MPDKIRKAQKTGRVCDRGTTTPSDGTPDGVAAGRKRSPFRIAASILLLLCIIGTMVMIFLLSSESKEDSGNRSDGVTAWIASVIFVDYDDLTPTEQTALLSMMASPVRKLAHMTEYAFLAVLCGAYYMLNCKRQGWMRWIVPIGFCLLYAITDEVHQIFSSRGPAVRDVLIDLSGAILGLCILYGIIGLVRLCIRRKEARRRKTRHNQRKMAGHMTTAGKGKSNMRRGHTRPQEPSKRKKEEHSSCK